MLDFLINVLPFMVLVYGMHKVTSSHRKSEALKHRTNAVGITKTINKIVKES